MQNALSASSLGCQEFDRSPRIKRDAFRHLMVLCFLEPLIA